MFSSLKIFSLLIVFYANEIFWASLVGIQIDENQLQLSLKQSFLFLFFGVRKAVDFHQNVKKKGGKANSRLFH